MLKKEFIASCALLWVASLPVAAHGLQLTDTEQEFISISKEFNLCIRELEGDLEHKAALKAYEIESERQSREFRIATDAYYAKNSEYDAASEQISTKYGFDEELKRLQEIRRNFDNLTASRIAEVQELAINLEIERLVQEEMGLVRPIPPERPYERLQNLKPKSSEEVCGEQAENRIQQAGINGFKMNDIAEGIISKHGSKAYLDMISPK
jgi:hypothetical protein